MDIAQHQHCTLLGGQRTQALLNPMVQFHALGVCFGFFGPVNQRRDGFMFSGQRVQAVNGAALLYTQYVVTGIDDNARQPALKAATI